MSFGLLMFPTEILSQLQPLTLLRFFAPKILWKCVRIVSSPLHQCEQTLLRVPRAGGCLCVEPLDLGDAGRKCSVQRKL